MFFRLQMVATAFVVGKWVAYMSQPVDDVSTTKTWAPPLDCPIRLHASRVTVATRRKVSRQHRRRGAWGAHELRGSEDFGGLEAGLHEAFSIVDGKTLRVRNWVKNGEL